MNLLLHCCCGPCAVGSLPQIQAAGYEPYCWFFNPNIHPYQEHKARRQAFCALMEQENLPFAAEKDYPLEDWLRAVSANPAARCGYCYRSRLMAAAEKAAEMGFARFYDHFVDQPLSGP